MKYNHTNITYSAADIQQYLEGKMSPAQMNALEKAALDDPFLYEAIEGYQAVKAEEWQPALQGLQQGFAAPANTTTAKVVNMGSGKRLGWLKYAAAVLILGGGITTFYLVNRPSNPNTTTSNLATVEKNKATDNELTKTPVITKFDSSTIGATDALANNNNVTSNSFSNLKPEKPTTGMFDDQLQRQDSNRFAINEVKPNTQAHATEELVISPLAGAENKDYKFATVPAAAPAKAKAAAPSAANITDDKKSEVALANKEQEWNRGRSNQNAFFNQQTLNNSQGFAVNEVNRSFSAQVVDANNNPLPFANINVTNERFGTYADARGNVRLVSTDSVIPIEVKSLGYETQNILLRSGDRPATIQLREDANIGYQEKTIDRRQASNNVMSRRAFLQKDAEQNAEPADGWEKYDTYISNNLVIPDDLMKKNVHGEVALSFDVQKNGAITNIKVDKSLCNDCDEIAKRIVAQGPQWKVKKGKKAKARVTVQF